MRSEDLKMGWWVEGKLIHTPFAYVDIKYWFSHFYAQFPETAVKVKEYNEKRGWGGEAAMTAWYPVITKWLFKKAERYK